MHISDGILEPQIAICLDIVAIGVFVYALKKMKTEEISFVASMSALFFIASFIHIPLGFTQIHLILIGFIGVFLGLSSFISIGIALILQAFLLGYGGILSFGANVFIMGTPAYLIYLIFKNRYFCVLNSKIKYFLVGFLGCFFAVLFLSLILLLSKDEYLIFSYTIFLANIPAMILEGLVTLFLFMYIKKSMPNLLRDYKI